MRERCCVVVAAAAEDVVNTVLELTAVQLDDADDDDAVKVLAVLMMLLQSLLLDILEGDAGAATASFTLVLDADVSSERGSTLGFIGMSDKLHFIVECIFAIRIVF